MIMLEIFARFFCEKESSFGIRLTYSISKYIVIYIYFLNYLEKWVVE